MYLGLVLGFPKALRLFLESLSVILFYKRNMLFHHCISTWWGLEIAYSAIKGHNAALRYSFLASLFLCSQVAGPGHFPFIMEATGERMEENCFQVYDFNPGQTSWEAPLPAGERGPDVGSQGEPGNSRDGPRWHNIIQPCAGSSRMHAHTHRHTHTHAYTHTHASTHTRTHTYTHRHTQTHTHTHMHTHTHTDMHTVECGHN